MILAGFLLFFVLLIMYFIYGVCIQFNYINNIGVLMGSNIDSLVSDDDDLMKTCAVFLYKISNKEKAKA